VNLVIVPGSLAARDARPLSWRALTRAYPLGGVLHFVGSLLASVAFFGGIIFALCVRCG